MTWWRRRGVRRLGAGRGLSRGCGGAAGRVRGLAVAAATQPGPVEEYDVALAARPTSLAADLVAACIAAGADPVVAAQAVGEALGEPVGERLARGAAEVRLGGEPVEAWRRLASLPGAGALARLLERAGESGVPAAVPVGRLAMEARAERGRTATARGAPGGRHGRRARGVVLSSPRSSRWASCPW